MMLRKPGDGMRLCFSRKGFDSGSGGTASPIIKGRPISLPIPTDKSERSRTSYNDLGLGEYVAQVTKGRIKGAHLCHHDPMFEDRNCAFGQTGLAQAHLVKHGIGVGDIFLFFGLFADEDGSDRHHRIFGYMRVEHVISLGSRPLPPDIASRFSHVHPHTLGDWNDNNTI